MSLHEKINYHYSQLIYGNCIARVRMLGLGTAGRAANETGM
jgi:hypothetical protein